jgi:hypothetical protein
VPIGRDFILRAMTEGKRARIVANDQGARQAHKNSTARRSSMHINRRKPVDLREAVAPLCIGELHKLASPTSEHADLPRHSGRWWDRRAQECRQSLTVRGETGEIWKTGRTIRVSAESYR